MAQLGRPPPATGCVKALGSGHSFTAIAVPDGVALIAPADPALLGVDAAGLATVPAGMTLLKALGMDHGNPTVKALSASQQGDTAATGSEQGHPAATGQVWFVSDEHLTFAPAGPLAVGDRVSVVPAHVDPTVTMHERMHVVRGEEVLDTWAVDLRGW